jgi:hypothetical protein
MSLNGKDELIIIKDDVDAIQCDFLNGRSQSDGFHVQALSITLCLPSSNIRLGKISMNKQ